MRSSSSFEQLLVTLGLVSRGDIASLIRLARRQNVSVLRLLRAYGLVSEIDTFGAVAVFHGLPFIAEADRRYRACVEPHEIESCLKDGWIELIDEDGRHVLAAAPNEASATTMRNLGGSHGRSQPIDAITTPSAIRDWITELHGDWLVDDATLWLVEHRPILSARRRLTRPQVVGLGIAVGFCVGGALVAPQTLFGAIFAAMTLGFLGLAMQRMVALIAEIGTRSALPARAEIPEAELPVYTILVPLYREAEMVERITAAILDLDYPRALLDIKLVLEADDGPTIAAAERLALPGCIEIVKVPASQPRTKPKALNYALRFARGRFVTVYDAEDVPDRDQLRCALSAFAAGGRRLACVQARLAIANTSDGWLTRQFALEYAALFQVLMPGFDRLGQPLMLGGTSNHFRIEALHEIGGWDPHNVTEDADIGIRLDRFGYRVRPLASETREDAPDSFGNWFGQRTRWLRGWMQTYLVHMREPRRLLSQLGPMRFLALQIVLAGPIVAALVHPVFVAYFFIWATNGALFVPSFQPVADTFLVASAINLVIGYGVVMEIVVLGLYRARRRDLLPDVLLTPLYWMLISLAAYVALLRLVIRPFAWEKTRHKRRDLPGGLTPP